MTSKENNNASNTLSYYYPIAKSIKKKSTTNGNIYMIFNLFWYMFKMIWLRFSLSNLNTSYHLYF